MVNEETKQNPEPLKSPTPEETNVAFDEEKSESMFSPRFRSVAAMAGWDEEALLIATLVVEDTPDRDSKAKKRPNLGKLKSPETNSRRKRRALRKSDVPIVCLDLDEEEPSREKPKVKSDVEDRKPVAGESKAETSGSSSPGPPIPCIDRLREELSCAICLEISYEPSTTACGHSFCKKCLRSAADKCGKRCPKCRQLIGNGRSCTVNTVLWNTIQLLFPEEIEARKAIAAGRILNSQSPARTNRQEVKEQSQSHESRMRRRTRMRNLESRNNSPSISLLQLSRISGRGGGGEARRRREEEVPPRQDEDAALALRLQREEFLTAFGRSDGDDGDHQRNSLRLAQS